jgi:hypothetical protein
MPSLRLVPARIDYQQLGVRLSRHEGDSAVWTETLPARLGRRNTRYLLIGLAAALVGMSAWLAARGFVSPLMSAPLAGGSAGLLFAVIRRALPDDDQCLGLLIINAPLQSYKSL